MGNNLICPECGGYTINTRHDDRRLHCSTDSCIYNTLNSSFKSEVSYEKIEKYAEERGIPYCEAYLNI